MLEFTARQGPRLDYRISDKITQHDLRCYYATVNRHYQRYGKLSLTATATQFNGYEDLPALGQFLRHEPGLLWKVRQYHIRSDDQRLLRIVKNFGKLLWWIAISTEALPKS